MQIFVSRVYLLWADCFGRAVFCKTCWQTLGIKSFGRFVSGIYILYIYRYRQSQLFCMSAPAKEAEGAMHGNYSPKQICDLCVLQTFKSILLIACFQDVPPWACRAVLQKDWEEALCPASRGHQKQRCRELGFVNFCSNGALSSRILTNSFLQCALPNQGFEPILQVSTTIYIYMLIFSLICIIHSIHLVRRVF